MSEVKGQVPGGSRKCATRLPGRQARALDGRKRSGAEPAVLQGDPAKPNADALFRLAAGTTAPPHWHNSAERMVLLSGEMEVTYEGQDPVILEPGTYAYGPPRLSHDATCRSDDDCVLFIAFEEPVDAIATEK